MGWTWHIRWWGISLMLLSVTKDFNKIFCEMMASLVVDRMWEIGVGFNFSDWGFHQSLAGAASGLRSAHDVPWQQTRWVFLPTHQHSVIIFVLSLLQSFLFYFFIFFCFCVTGCQSWCLCSKTFNFVCWPEGAFGFRKFPCSLKVRERVHLSEII